MEYEVAVIHNETEIFMTLQGCQIWSLHGIFHPKDQWEEISCLHVWRVCLFCNFYFSQMYSVFVINLKSSRI